MTKQLPDVPDDQWKTTRSDDADRVWSYLETVTDDLGFSFSAHADTGKDYDAHAALDLYTFAFRIDGPVRHGRQRDLVIVVRVDWDADGTPGEGWTDLSTVEDFEMRLAPARPATPPAAASDAAAAEDAEDAGHVPQIFYSALSPAACLEWLAVGQEGPPLILEDGAGHVTVARESDAEWSIEVSIYGEWNGDPASKRSQTCRSAEELCEALRRLGRWSEA